VSETPKKTTRLPAAAVAPAAALVWLVVVAGTARGESFATLPTALPLHSALPEDAATTEPSTLRIVTPKPDLAAPGTFGAVAPGMFEPAYVSGPSFLPAEYPGKDWPMPTPGPLLSLRPTYIPPDSRSGMFQGGLVRGTYLPRLDNASGFGFSSVTKQITLAVPPFIKGSPILFSPGYTVHFLDGPASTDAPPRLHDVELEFRWMNQLTCRWGVDTAIAPSYYGDFENSDDAFRVTGRIIAAFSWSPRLRIVGGVLFLGREDYPILPIGGIAWEPTDDWNLELVFPRPRAYYRFYNNDAIEHRAFVGGEFGGNTWAIDRAGGVHDRFTYRDLRAVVGWERKAKRGITARIETGWVFSREIEYESGVANFKPDGTFMVRGEATF
jgi:hypothetical protein